MTDPDDPEYLWEHEHPHAQKYGFLLRVEQHPDGRWSASFDRLDSDQVWVFWASSEERLLLQVQTMLAMVDAVLRGLARRSREQG